MWLLHLQPAPGAVCRSYTCFKPRQRMQAGVPCQCRLVKSGKPQGQMALWFSLGVRSKPLHPLADGAGLEECTDLSSDRDGVAAFSKAPDDGVAGPQHTQHACGVQTKPVEGLSGPHPCHTALAVHFDCHAQPDPACHCCPGHPSCSLCWQGSAAACNTPIKLAGAIAIVG